MKKINSFFKYADRKAGVWAAVFSCLTLFSVLTYLAPSWYDRPLKLSELVCGQTIWDGYAKQADLSLVKWALFGSLLLYLLFMGIFCVIHRAAYLDKMECIVLGGGYLGCLLLIAGRRENAGQYATLSAALAVCYLIGRRGSREKNESRFQRNILAAFLGMFFVLTMILVVSAWKPGMAHLWQSLGSFMMVVFILLLCLLCLLKERADRFVEMLYSVQLILPLSFLGMMHFRYAYEPEKSMMELFGSSRWKLCCVAMALILCAVCIWQIFRRKQKLSVSTFVVVAALRVFTQPDGILSVDFFHNGELSLPMQQLMSEGRLPYRDLIPIHGMCDYFFGALDVLLFDGSYLSLNAAKIVGNLLMAAFLAVVIYYFVENHLQGLLIVYLFMPYLIGTAGMRYLFLFVLFFVLFSPRLKDGMAYLYAWILLSILSTAWNASIGGAAAIAFLPVVLYRCVRFFPGQMKDFLQNKPEHRAGKLFAWVALFVLGVSYIPLFSQIVLYLMDNTGTTLYVNGMAMFQEEISQGALLTAFGFLIPILFCLYFTFEKGKNRAGEYLVSLICCFYVLFNYAFVRYDEGLRATVIDVFFTLLVMVTLLYEGVKQEVRGKQVIQTEQVKQAREKQAIQTEQARETRGQWSAIYCYLAAMFLGIWFADSSPWMTSDGLALVRDIPGSIETTIAGTQVEDPVVYVTGDSVQMPGLGNGFVQGNTLKSLQNVQHVLLQQLQGGETCLDITNEIANQVIFDRDNFWRYTSAYNISNDRMQKKAVALLQEGLPDMILAAPAIVFDEAPFSFRSPILFQYLMKQGYSAYKYENVIYLVRGENRVEDAVQDGEAFAQLMHKEKLFYLPGVWGAAAAGSGQLEDTPVGCQVIPEQDGFSIQFERPLSGSELSVLLLHLPLSVKDMEGEQPDIQKDADAADGNVITVTWETDLSAGGEACYEFYAGRTQEYAVPLGLSPYFGFDGRAEKITFTYDTEQITVDAAKIACECKCFKEKD